MLRTSSEDVEQGMAIEVDPDEGSGDAALVTAVGANVTHGVDRGFLTGDAVGDALEFCELELSDHRLEIGASERVVRPFW